MTSMFGCNRDDAIVSFVSDISLFAGIKISFDESNLPYACALSL